MDTTRYGQRAGGTHPTGMHSCVNCIQQFMSKEKQYNRLTHVHWWYSMKKEVDYQRLYKVNYNFKLTLNIRK